MEFRELIQQAREIQSKKELYDVDDFVCLLLEFLDDEELRDIYESLLPSNSLRRYRYSS